MGKTVSFTPDEANVDDLAKPCKFSTQFILFSENTDLVSYTDFLNVPFWEGMVVLKGLIFNNHHIGKIFDSSLLDGVTDFG